jgi:hypothetical protein
VSTWTPAGQVAPLQEPPPLDLMTDPRLALAPHVPWMGGLQGEPKHLSKQEDKDKEEHTALSHCDLTSIAQENGNQHSRTQS